MSIDPGAEDVIERSHAAWDRFMTGDPEPAKALFSHGDDVSLGNPFGPFVRGWKDAAETMERASTHYRDGRATGFDRISTIASPDVVCIVEVEHYNAKVGGADEPSDVALRVTSVLRRDDGSWKIVHRHADPITSARPAESVIQTG
jgi:ketosteroid isomerase-like protein